MGFTYPNNSQDKTVVWETVPRDAGTVLLSQDIYWQWLLFSEGQVSPPPPIIVKTERAQIPKMSWQVPFLRRITF